MSEFWGPRAEKLDPATMRAIYKYAQELYDRNTAYPSVPHMKKQGLGEEEIKEALRQASLDRVSSAAEKAWALFDEVRKG